jgi:GT2 family glycosyltransferase
MTLDYKPKVSCIILNWNGWRDTLECLDALRRCTYQPLEVIVVDNASTNDSVVRIHAAHPEITLLQSATNAGFAAGNNIGIRHALAHGSDYVWLLNNDTKPAPESLSALVATAMSDKKIGAVASVCYFAHAPSTIQAWAGSRINLWIGYSRLITQPEGAIGRIDSLNGTSMLVTRSALADVGLLDEGFFLYWEDTEFCLRLRKNGWRIAAAPDSHVLHRVNGSTAGNRFLLDRHQTASGLRILRLHSRAPHFSLGIFVAMRLARRLCRLQFDRCKSVLAGIRDYRNALPVTQKIR